MYNFAHTGYGPAGEILTLHRLLGRGVVPDCLLVEVVPPFLAEPGIPAKMLPPAALGYADTAHLIPYRTDPAGAWAKWASARALTWHSLRFSLLSHAGFGDWLPKRLQTEFLWEQMQPGGWLPFSPAALTPEQRAAALARARADYAPYFDNLRIDPLQDRMLRDLIGLGRERGIRVGLFVMPESPTFRGWYPPGARHQTRRYLAGLADEYRVPVFDASDWYDDEELYWDGHHLLGPGAEAFSRRFGAECLRPWARSR